MKAELETAFDDLGDLDDDDDDGSINYSENSSSNHNNVAALTNPSYGLDTKAHIDNLDADRINEIMQLRNTLASKNEEFRNITSEFTNERLRFQKKIDELNKRLAIAESEKERAIMSRQQTHELFVESKQKLSLLEEEMCELNSKIQSFDVRNMELMSELESTKTLLTDTQHKYHMLERNNSYSSEKHTDSVIKQINDRNAAQTDMMQQQINTMRKKLEERDNELKLVTIQYNELQKSRECLLLDKADAINQLTERLDESQRRCQEIIMKSTSSGDLVQENARLKNSITEFKRRTDEMQQTIKDLTMRFVIDLEHNSRIFSLKKAILFLLQTGNDINGT